MLIESYSIILNSMETLVSPKIFLVEDDLSYNEAVKQSLEKSKFNNIKTFTNGSDFLKGIKKEKPDLVILDYNLNDSNGPEILEKMKGLNSSIHIVVLSANGKMEVGPNGLKTGRFDYVKKDKTAFSRLRAIALKTESEIEEQREEKKALIYRLVFFSVFFLIVVSSIIGLRLMYAGNINWR